MNVSRDRMFMRGGVPPATFVTMCKPPDLRLATACKSFTNPRISWWRVSSSGARKIDDGCTVAVTSCRYGVPDEFDKLPAMLRHAEIPSE